MRTGLLSRFWGSLGMAVGVAALIGLTPLALLWFFYLGLLLVGVLPGGQTAGLGGGRSGPLADPGQNAPPSLDPARTIDRSRTSSGPDQPEARRAATPRRSARAELDKPQTQAQAARASRAG